jgi:predicted GNAT family acetyltransferase
MENYELIDNTDQNQYEFHIGKYIPKIEYIKKGNNEILLTHTEIPINLEGQGIGSALVKAVLSDIEEQGLDLVPLCPFVVGYISKHPEWKRVVKKGIDL